MLLCARKDFVTFINMKLVQVDLNLENHCTSLISLLNEYMKDEMGIGEALPVELAPYIIEGLKKHSAYIGFFVEYEQRFIALANCNLNYSTWKAKFIINIHDFIVHPEFRNKGIGVFLLEGIKNYAINKGYCKLNLEVREDNTKAKKLYRKVGFAPGKGPMLFWELEF